MYDLFTIDRFAVYVRFTQRPFSFQTFVYPSYIVHLSFVLYFHLGFNESANGLAIDDFLEVAVLISMLKT